LDVAIVVVSAPNNTPRRSLRVYPITRAESEPARSSAPRSEVSAEP
jgi:hypothetical protein